MAFGDPTARGPEDKDTFVIYMLAAIPVLQTNALYFFLPLLGVVHKGHNVLSHCMYKVVHLLANLGWVDLDLECSNVLLGQ